MESVEDIYDVTRRFFFRSLVDIYFIVPEDRLEFYFVNSEGIFGFIQSERQATIHEVYQNISNIRQMFDEQKRFEFDREFFDSAVLNAIIDGYEPLSDICWNTVEILMAKEQIPSETAYRIAVSTMPSFRYVVRHLEEHLPVSGAKIIYGKVYCFLSTSVLKFADEATNEINLAFGRGRHVCAGRGLVERMIPSVAQEICNFLRPLGVNSIALVRHDSLGSEGVISIRYMN